jgi:hypothetical protein
MILLAMAAAILAACTAATGHPGATRSAPAAQPSGANTAPPPDPNAAPPAGGGGAFCDVVRTSQKAMGQLSQKLFANPTDTEANWNGIVEQWRTMAAAAPPELRDDYRVILDTWKRVGDEAAKNGWDLLALMRAEAKQMQNDAFQKAYEHNVRYLHDRCGIDPFDLLPSA